MWCSSTDSAFWTEGCTEDGQAGTILPPTIVGFHGVGITFDQEQVKLDESHGTAVTPQSLYEAQLEKRLGHLPPWIEALK